MIEFSQSEHMSPKQKEALDRIQKLLLKEENERPSDYLECVKGKEHKESLKTFRSRLIQWCVDVLNTIQFKKNCTFYATSLFDRYLSALPIQERSQVLEASKQMQLVMIAALFVSIKMHEPLGVSSAFFAQLTCDVFKPEDIEEMEMRILSRLNWKLNAPTVLCFMQEYALLLSLLDCDASKQEVVFCENHMKMMITKIHDYKYLKRSAFEVAISIIVSRIGKEDNAQHSYADTNTLVQTVLRFSEACGSKLVNSSLKQFMSKSIDKKECSRPTKSVHRSISLETAFAKRCKLDERSYHRISPKRVNSLGICEC